MMHATALIAALTVTPQVRITDFGPRAQLTGKQVETWIDAVERHQSGKADEPAQTIAEWSADELFELFNEFRALDAFRGNPLVRRDAANGMHYPAPQFAKNIAQLLRLTPEERRTGNINRLLLRAALLHTDAQLIVKPLSHPLFLTTSPFSDNAIVQSNDGMRTGMVTSAAHLEFASWVLDGIRRDANTDNIVRGWYESVTAALHADKKAGDARWLLSRGRRLYADDLVLQFLSGTLEEMLATASAQAGMRSPTFGGKSPDVELDSAGLKRADEFISKSLELYPGYLDARLHLGRVAGLRGEHQRAVDLLKSVSTKATLDEHRYYVALFLGRELDAIGDAAGARQQFERASAIFPRAQSPLLSLSELARRHGDAAGARTPLERLLTSPADNEHPDPIWWYFTFHVLDAPERVQQWRDILAGALPK
jgi:tetratricopeptide (TPR) repeat protein